MEKPYPFQAIFDIAAWCATLGVEQAVLSPGSRCALLALAFARHPDITARTFSDERAAAYVALGMAQRSGKPVVLVCTSGTAALNYGPAVAEAFYAEVPLLVLTADRPPEWIDQQDGQAIRQTGLYAQHCLASYQLPADPWHVDSAWHIRRSVSEALNLCQGKPKGPVHVNVPIREPFYPENPAGLTFSAVPPIRELRADAVAPSAPLSTSAASWPQSGKVLFVAGQQVAPPEALANLATKWPVLGDIIANTHGIAGAIRRQDAFLGNLSETQKAALRPDLLISWGGSLISKNLKLFLRKFPPKQHWHLQEAGKAADTFRCLSHIIRSEPAKWLDLAAHENTLPASPHFLQQWQQAEAASTQLHTDFFATQHFSELEVVDSLLRHLPAPSSLHLANSMSVRYGNFASLSAKQGEVQVWANRGTSGIDGCNSTLMGHALLSSEPQFLVTGDLAFFYDRNAFWHNYPKNNLRILVLNNQGGVIFRMIPGPAALPEADEFFVTQQNLQARHLAEEMGFAWLAVEKRDDFRTALSTFVAPGESPMILEVRTNGPENARIFGAYKRHFAEGLTKLFQH